MNGKAILASLLTIGVAATMLGTGIAQFFDEETSEGNTFTSGTLNLKVGANDPTTYSFAMDDVAPGESRTTSVDLMNTGSIDASKLEITWTVNDSDPEQTEPELEMDPGSTIYDISAHTVVTIKYDAVDITSEIDAAVGDDTAPLYLSELDGAIYDFGALANMETKTLEMTLTLEEVGNAYQADMSTIDMVFCLEQ